MKNNKKYDMIRGEIVSYNEAGEEGQIISIDGNQYTFKKNNFMSIDVEPVKGMAVCFRTHNNLAHLILQDLATYPEQKPNVKERVKSLFLNGIHNPVAVLMTIFAGVSLFLPVLSVPRAGNLSLVEFDFGMVSMSLLIALGFMLYSGISLLVIRATASLAVISVLAMYHDLYQKVSVVYYSNLPISPEPNPAIISPSDFVQYGLWVSIFGLSALLFSSFSNMQEQK